MPEFTVCLLCICMNFHRPLSKLWYCCCHVYHKVIDDLVGYPSVRDLYVQTASGYHWSCFKAGPMRLHNTVMCSLYEDTHCFAALQSAWPEMKRCKAQDQAILILATRTDEKYKKHTVLACNGVPFRESQITATYQGLRLGKVRLIVMSAAPVTLVTLYLWAWECRLALFVCEDSTLLNLDFAAYRQNESTCLSRLRIRQRSRSITAIIGSDHCERSMICGSTLLGARLCFLLSLEFRSVISEMCLVAKMTPETTHKFDRTSLQSWLRRSLLVTRRSYRLCKVCCKGVAASQQAIQGGQASSHCVWKQCASLNLICFSHQ